MKTIIIRLSMFVLGALLVTSLCIFGVHLPYQRAYALTHPQRFPVLTRPKGIHGYQEVAFQTSDGLTLQGWYVPPENGAVIIFVHGLGANRTILLSEAHLFAQRGYGLLLFDLRNSGNSQGDVSTLGMLETEDVLAAVDFVQSQTGPDSPLALVGHSMGSAAVLLAAARAPQVDCVVTISAFTSLEENIADSIQTFTGLPAFPFAPLVIFWGQQQTGLDISRVRPIDALANIGPRPILFIHGQRDDMVSVRNSQRLYDAYTGPKELYILPQASHSDFGLDDSPQSSRRLIQFLKACLGQP